MVCSTAASALAAKRAQGLPSCVSTARRGPPTKTASSCVCWRRKSPLSPGKNPQEHYNELAKRFGAPSYNRLQAAATSAQKAALSKLSPEMVSASTLAGDPITARLTAAPGNGASIGGLKVMTDNGWFAARPSGTEDAYKIYCESFLGEEHRKQIEKEAVEIVSEVLKNA